MTMPDERLPADSSGSRPAATSSRWRRSCRVLLAVYLVLLTAGLLAKNPFAAAGSGENWLRKFYVEHLEWCGHFLAFSLLGVLCLASCSLGVFWSRRTLYVMVGLSIYAVTVEAAQRFVPSRSVQWQDVLQNLGGLLAGAAAFALLTSVAGGRRVA